jgi:hypothetical protein
VGADHLFTGRRLSFIALGAMAFEVFALVRLTCILQWFGHGVSGNAEFDLILAVALGLGATFNRMEASPLARWTGIDRCRTAMVAALLLRLFLADRQETASAEL